MVRSICLCAFISSISVKHTESEKGDIPSTKINRVCPMKDERLAGDDTFKRDHMQSKEQT